MFNCKLDKSTVIWFLAPELGCQTWGEVEDENYWDGWKAVFLADSTGCWENYWDGWKVGFITDIVGSWVWWAWAGKGLAAPIKFGSLSL